MKKKLTDLLFSSKVSIQGKMFMVGGCVGSVLLSVMFLVVLLTGQPFIVASALGAGAVVLILATVYSYHSRNYTFGSSVVILLLNGLVTPLGYFTSGGAESGSPAWFVVCGMFVFVLFRGRLMWFFLLFSVGVFGAISWYSAAYPESVTPLEGGYAAVAFDTFMAAAAACILAGLVLRFQRILLERETRLAQEQQREIQKMNDAQNRFFSSMSHEIRTPINTIIGLNEMTLRERDLPQEIVDNATGIQNASKMLLSLINDILDLSKIQSGRMEVVEGQYETTRMLSEIVNLLWNRAREKGLRFDINVGEAVPSMLYGDEMRIKQVIVNLLTNAIKYTSEGTVTLNVDGEKLERNRFLLRIDVSDTGAGIRKESIPYLFDSFRRVDEQDNKAIEGTGLGLSIARQLVELMGGTISVDSIYTKGSTFRVEVPQNIVNDAPANYRQISAISKENTTYLQAFEAPEAQVLIVDDNEMNRVVAAKLLRGTMVKVDMASSGRECLDLTREKRYDAIFMDHEMPDMDGIETLDRLRTQENGLCRETPVIALTANAGSDMGRFYADKGFQAYLAKPIHSSLLEATLMQLLPSELIERTTLSGEEESMFVGQSLRKRAVMITTDCLCDLPEKMVHDLGIRLMPYYIVTDEGRFRDLSEIDADNLLRYIEAGKKSVRTEASTVGEYEAFFGEALSAAEQVIHLSLGSNYDKGFQNAMHAAESFNNVHVVDTGQLTCGLGILAVRAARMAREGRGAEEILGDVAACIPRIRLEFIVPQAATMLQKRFASRVVGIVTRIFNFAPVFRIRKGSIRVSSFCTGYVTEPAEQFVRKTLSAATDADESALYVSFSGCSFKERDQILSYINKYKSFDKIVMQKASATISANCGFGSFSLAYLRKEKA